MNPSHSSPGGPIIEHEEQFYYQPSAEILTTLSLLRVLCHTRLKNVIDLFTEWLAPTMLRFAYDPLDTHELSHHLSSSHTANIKHQSSNISSTRIFSKKYYFLPESGYDWSCEARRWPLSENCKKFEPPCTNTIQHYTLLTLHQLITPNKTYKLGGTLI